MSNTDTPGQTQTLRSARGDGPAWAFEPKRTEHGSVVRPVSCVVWSSNAAPRLARPLPWLSDVLTECGHPWEVVIVDARSTDDTSNLLRRWSDIPAVRTATLSRHGDDALSVGLTAARGDAVIFLDANASQSPALIPQMIAHWEDGAEVVYAPSHGLPVRSELNWFGTSVFDGLNAADKKLDWLANRGDLTLLSRRVVTHLSR